VVHFFDADTADIAVTGSWGSVDIASEAKLDSIYADGLWNDIADLNMTPDVLIFGNGQVFFVWFASLGLGEKRGTIF